MEFEAFINDIRSNGWNVYGVEVYERGVLTHAWGDTRENLHPIYSATKSILSVAVGIARDRGLIGLDRPLTDYLPAERVRRMAPAQRDAYGIITLKRLMTMSVAGLPFAAQGESWLDHALSCPIPHPEEKVFNYSNNSAYLVGVALTEALGSDVGALIEESIFAPLGIQRYEYSRCPEGYFYGASAMRLTVHDLSRIGLMLYSGGVWEGQRIVSEAYVREATSVQQPCAEGGYGYLFWKYRDGFSINGKLKQKCYVLPDRGLVITYLANIEDPSPVMRNCMEKRLLGIPTGG